MIRCRYRFPYMQGIQVVVVWVPIKGIEILERIEIEEESDLRAARRSMRGFMREKSENIPWESLKQELGLNA